MRGASRCGDRRGLVQPLMRTGPIVEADVDVEYPTQVGLADDEQVVEALLARRPDPPLSDRVRVGRTIGRADDRHPLAPKDGVEGRDELAVPVMEQVAGREVTV